MGPCSNNRYSIATGGTTLIVLQLKVFTDLPKEPLATMLEQMEVMVDPEVDNAPTLTP